MASQNRRRTTQYSTEFGDSGVAIFSGIISDSDEYISSLRGPALMRTIEEMRRGDSTVKAGLIAAKAPLIAADWYAQAAGKEKVDLDIKALTDHTMVKVLHWKQRLLPEILTMIDFGFSVFEIVVDWIEFEGKEYLVPVKVAYRKQTTIQAWETKEKKRGITQMTANGEIVSIPDEKMIPFTFQQEGDNWQGLSILRPAYSSWYYKKHMEKIEALQQERQGLGVVKIKHPVKASDTMKQSARQGARNLRANEQAYIEEPEGWEIDFMDMKANTVADPTKAIARHDRNILKSMQVQYLDIGASESSGSYSASDNQMELLQQTNQALGSQIAARINEKLVKLIVDLNFTGADYPEWTCGEIAKSNVKEFAEVYKTLVDAGGLNPSEADEDHLRTMLDLPDRVTEDTDDEKTTTKSKTSKDKDNEVDEELEQDEVKASRRAVLASISSRDFPDLYDGTGVNPDDLGCIMLDVEPMDVLKHLPEDSHADLVDASSRHDHAMGAVAEKEAHVTLLYGLLENGNVWKDKVDAVLSDWKLDKVKIAEVGFFETPDSYAVIAHVELTDDLVDGHERLTLLPHIQTFSEYKPHITLAYVDKDADVAPWVEALGSAYNGTTVKALGINYGDEPDKGAVKAARVLADARKNQAELEQLIYGRSALAA
ncbi:phage portal protein family protein [Gordonia terrae]|nr:DUF935 family protein [Gordonia terrae]